MDQSELDRICRERMEPITRRMEALAAECQRLREGAAVDEATELRVAMRTAEIESQMKAVADAFEFETARLERRA